jgi:hypothetical protein
MAELTVEKAKAFLKQNGYFVDNLWSVNDVFLDWECTEEQAQMVLQIALTNASTYGVVWESINETAIFFNLKQKI